MHFAGKAFAANIIFRHRESSCAAALEPFPTALQADRLAVLDSTRLLMPNRYPVGGKRSGRWMRGFGTGIADAAPAGRVRRRTRRGAVHDDGKCPSGRLSARA